MASIFAKIVAGDIPSYKIYEDEKTAIFAGYIIRVNYKKDTILTIFLIFLNIN